MVRMIQCGYTWLNVRGGYSRCTQPVQGHGPRHTYICEDGGESWVAVGHENSRTSFWVHPL